MKIERVYSLDIDAVKVVNYSHFPDKRGYFTETYRYNDLNKLLGWKDKPIAQCNESFSKLGTVRGLHFQWNPYMGKLVRTINGHMVDMVLDIRKGSPSFGKILLHDMPASISGNNNEWIWVPPGFAHGNVFLEDTTIEYLCTGEYNPKCEAGITPLSVDIDWSLCNEKLKNTVLEIIQSTTLMTDKDRNALIVCEWVRDQRSDNFIYGDL